MAFIFAIAIVFILSGSMSPSASAKAARSSHDISQLEPGDYLFEDLGRKNAWNAKVLIIKDWDSSLYVYLVPTENGKVPLPERWWGWAAFGVYCKDFGPETDTNSKILKSGTIKCLDKPSENESFETWLWTYDGKSRGSWITELYRPKFEVVEQNVYINQ